MSEMITTEALDQADRDRGVDLQSAMAAYASASPVELAADEARVLWIFESLRGSLDERFLPLAQHVAKSLSGTPRRWALKFLATSAWYAGDHDSAEINWRCSMEEGREVRDELWVGVTENLAMIFSHRGRTFESLVLNGMALRASQASGFASTTAFGAARRGSLLTSLGEYQRAAFAFRDAALASSRIEEEARRLGVESSIASGRASLFRAMGDFDSALLELEKLLDYCRTLPPAQRASLMAAESHRIELLYELHPRRRGQLVAEMEQLPELYPTSERWDASWRNELLHLRLRYVLEELRDRELALELARELLAFVQSHADDERLMERASELGNLFTDQLDSPEDSHAAYVIAATAALRRLLAVNRSAHELPELAEATPEDWEILSTYRSRLLSQHAEMFEAIRRLWKAGNPAYDLVLDEEGTLKACGWCRRILSLEGDWLPIAPFLPPARDFEVSYGMCPSCREGLGRDS